MEVFMNRLVVAGLLTVLAGTSFLAQAQPQRDAERLKTFESEWLIAGLNNDSTWLEKFFSQKLDVMPSDIGPTKERISKTIDLTDPTLRPDEYKIRISGTISVLTSDPNKNRSFAFLDTFNKRGGKWQVIASNFSADKNTESQAEIQQELINLENQWAQVDVTQDKSAFERIIAPDFVTTSTTGQILDRQEWLAAQEHEGIKRATNGEMQVHIYSDNLAIVTGVDTALKVEAGGKETIRRDRFTDTWMKRNGQWQVIATQVTRLQ
jgi:hypothetical protein